jgi:hypothetical protein
MNSKRFACSEHDALWLRITVLDVGQHFRKELVLAEPL